jgi:hypothetical protein
VIITSSACIGGLSFSHIALYSRNSSDLNFSPVAGPYHVPDMFGKNKKSLSKVLATPKRPPKKEV